jgi:hypothetical protein
VKTLDAALLAEAGAVASQPMHLVEIGFSTPVRLCSWGDVTWNGALWVGADVVVAAMKSDGTGAGSAELRLSNHDNLLGAYLLTERIADRPIKIYAAWVDASGGPHVTEAVFGAGGGAKVGETAAAITVVPAGSALLHAPREMISAAYGFSRLRPDGTRFRWNGADYTLERRLA